MLAQVVVGANYGDEGKGLMTDYLCKLEEAQWVVRFNGGGQAGHTVVTPEGKRHVFNSFGAGTLQGVKTYLAKDFVCNPILFIKEQNDLKLLTRPAPTIRPLSQILTDKNATVSLITPIPRVSVDPRCKITTPYDMLMNQAFEKKNAHGSCGVGFGETIERNERMLLVGGIDNYYGNQFSLTVADLLDAETLYFKLQLIRRVWFQARLVELGISYTPELKEMVMSDAGLWKFMDVLDEFNKSISIHGPEKLKGSSIVFEGAQGLALDQIQGHFPHVTRSNTGLKNVVEVAQSMGVTALQVHYTTRSYLTRHGNGPLPNERKSPPTEFVVDTTNKTNQYQGQLRYAHLDVKALRNRISHDLKVAQISIDRLNPKLKLTPWLAVTCLDQMYSNVHYWKGATLHKIERELFPKTVANEVGMSFVTHSHGRTRNDVRLEMAI